MNKQILVFLLFTLLLTSVYSEESGLVIENASIVDNKYLEVSYTDTEKKLDNDILVLTYVLIDSENNLSTNMLDQEVSKYLYDYKLIEKSNPNNREIFLENFKVNASLRDNIGLSIFNERNLDLNGTNLIVIDLETVNEMLFDENLSITGFIPRTKISKDTTQVLVYLARYDLGKGILSSTMQASYVSKKNLVFNNLASQNNMFYSGNKEVSQFSFDYTYEEKEKFLVEEEIPVPETPEGIEGELEPIILEEITPSTEQEEEIENILVTSTFDSDLNLEKTFDINGTINYKLLSLGYTNKGESASNKPYTYNSSKTFVIPENTIDKTITLSLSPASTTKEIYLAIDTPQSKTIPAMTSFSRTTTPRAVITKQNITQYYKFDKSVLTNQSNKLVLEVKADVSNFSLQVIEVSANGAVTGIYSTNILQLSNEEFVKYNVFQTNKNLINFYCPSCIVKDYGINENGFSSCGKSTFVEEKKPIAQYLYDSGNLCLVPDGSEIGGFTSEAMKSFGLDRLFFGWDEEDIYSGVFDYGEYYVDQDQFRIAANKKLNYISSNEYTELGDIKLRLGKNKLIARTFTSLDFNLSSEIGTNNSIDESLVQTKATLSSIPEPLKKLTVVDLYNWQAKINETEFDNYFKNTFTSGEYYEAKDYHTHYQFTLEAYLNNQDKITQYFLDKQDEKSRLYLYNLSQIISGFTNIYYAEGLDYYIYNIKPFEDLKGETNEIFTNKYTNFLSNYWSLHLEEESKLKEAYSPKPVLVRLKITGAENKDANYSLEEIIEPLLLGTTDYYSNNSNYAYNTLFKETNNPVSYTYNTQFFPKSNSTKDGKEIKEIVDDYSNLQDGYILKINSGNIEIADRYPLVITEEFPGTSAISIVKEGYYSEYLENLSILDSETSNNQTTIIYPYSKTKLQISPIQIKSSTPLVLNEDIESKVEDEEYSYSVGGKVESNYNFAKMVEDISKGDSCFTFRDNQFLVWNNIDGYLEETKEKLYAKSPISGQQASIQNNYYNQTIFSNQNTQATFQYALYIEPQATHNQLIAAKSASKFLDNTILDKKTEILKNNFLAYQKLEAPVPNFTKYIDYDNSNICDVVKSATATKFSLTCKPNTPTQATKDFWPNPKVNFCSAFVRNFTKYQFNYNFDSADAWNLSYQPNNISLWSSDDVGLTEENWKYLIPGSVLGIKHYNTSHYNERYSHVITYLGKIGSKHYVAHSWGSRFKIERLDTLLKTVARGKNSYGVYVDGKILEVMISKDIYNQIKIKAKEEGILLGSYQAEEIETQIPSYTFDSFSNQLASTSSSQKQKIDAQMLEELEETYNNILARQFDIYYKMDYVNPEAQEYNEQINLDREKPMIIILGKYKQLFLVKKTEGKTQILGQYPIATGVNGFGCVNDSLKTPLGLFRVIGRQGHDYEKFQIIGSTKFAKKNSGTPQVVTRKLTIEGLLKENIGTGCETGNLNTISRGIYIHGTNYENSMGKQKSHGCVRMLNDDVINLFDSVPTGTYVYITLGDLNKTTLGALEESLISTDVEISLVMARKPATIMPEPVIDPDLYIQIKVNNFKMLKDRKVKPDLSYGKQCVFENDAFKCYLYEALNVEYASHIISPQSDEFNIIVFRTAKAFGYSFEETAQFWGSLAQESGTSTNIGGRDSNHGKSLAGKPAKGIAQIEKSPWSNYAKNRNVLENMVQDFKAANLSEINKIDPQIKAICAKGGSHTRIDSRQEIIALLDLTWTNKSKYASVVFSAGLKRYISRRLIEETGDRYAAGEIETPFWYSQRVHYDNPDSINYAFATIYKYKYSGSLKMYDGIKAYNKNEFEQSTITTIILKLANYLAFKKEYYIVHNHLKSANDSKLMSAYNAVYGR